MKKVRAGRCYRYRTGTAAHRFFPPTAELKDGDTVCVVTCPGCPPPGTLGFAHVEKGGEFIGMVHVGALEEINGGEKKE